MSARAPIKDVRYQLLPVFANLLKPDRDMQTLIDRLRAPYAAQFAEMLATADQLLYRRGNFNGPMDQVICDALRQELDAQIALSPGFRWGATVLAGQPITMEDVLSETAITYPEVYVQEMTRKPAQGHHGGHLRQSVQSGSLLSAGRRHGAGRRNGLRVRAGANPWATEFRTCGSMTGARSKPTRAIGSPDGHR